MDDLATSRATDMPTMKQPDFTHAPMRPGYVRTGRGRPTGVYLGTCALSASLPYDHEPLLLVYPGVS